jgi:recombination protein RecT
MSEIQVPQPPMVAMKQFFDRPDVSGKIKELLGKRSIQFVTSALSAVNSNALLQKATPKSVYMAVMTAATLDLPINPNLGFAYIVPYKGDAQFQMGYKGFIQLAQRSGQFKTISAAPIYDGQLVEENPLTGFVFDFKAKKSDVIVGYAAYFELLNGFQKTYFMTKKQVEVHAKKYSKTFSNGPWASDFDGMAQKTVIKLLLSKFAPLSIEMQKAIVVDQAVINDYETEDVDYVDNTPEKVDKEEERVKAMIEMCGTNVQELEKLAADVAKTSPDYVYLVAEKIAEVDNEGE